MRPVASIFVMVGYNENPKATPSAAKTANIDSYKKKYPWTLLKCRRRGGPRLSGSSEVGHLNMGAGRIVIHITMTTNFPIRSSNRQMEKLVATGKPLIRPLLFAPG